MNGAQDYDFIFRCAEKAARIARVPRVLYHWRTHSASTADNPMSKQYAYEAGRRAIEHHLERTGTDGEVELLKDFGFYRVRYPVIGEPTVSVMIPNRDQTESLRAASTRSSIRATRGSRSSSSRTTAPKEQPSSITGSWPPVRRSGWSAGRKASITPPSTITASGSPPATTCFF